MYISKGRDLARSVREVVDDELARAGETYIAGTVAQAIVERLRRDDPELLIKFLDQHAVHVITKMIGDINRSQRTHARMTSGRTVYAKAVERFEGGDDNALGSWLDTMYVVTSKNQRKRLRDMDKDDLVFAAHDYAERSKANAAQAAFLQALAARVGARVVGDVFSDEELARMWSSIS